MMRICSIAAVAALALAGCAAPAHRDNQAQAAVSNDPDCVAIRAEIDRNQKAKLQAPTLSSTPIIQDATTAKADNAIGDLRARYQELDCDNPQGAKQPPDASPQPTQPLP